MMRRWSGISRGMRDAISPFARKTALTIFLIDP
jgi:hypothetical protein